MAKADLVDLIGEHRSEIVDRLQALLRAQLSASRVTVDDQAAAQGLRLIETGLDSLTDWIVRPNVEDRHGVLRGLVEYTVQFGLPPMLALSNMSLVVEVLKDIIEQYSPTEQQANLNRERLAGAVATARVVMLKEIERRKAAQAWPPEDEV